MNDRRLVVVRNPNSTRAHRVEREVINPLYAHGKPFVTLETRSPHTEDNIADMQEFLRDGDIALGVGGDGTGMQLTNAVLRSGLNVELGFLPYGNFNDLARVHGLRNPLDAYGDVATTELHPLTIDIDGEYWRDAPAYATMGWSAIAASQFGHTESRDRMRRGVGGTSLIPSLGQLARHYFEHRDEKLPSFHTSHSDVVRRAVTDIMAVNSPRVGAVVQSRENHYDQGDFGYHELDVSRILPNIPFGLRALFGRTPTSLRSKTSVEFDAPASVPIQTEGEFARPENVSRIDIYKDPAKSVTVIHR